MSDIEELRGRQITIGKATVIVPVDEPVTDDEIIEVEELIDEIAKASAPARRCVKSADNLSKLLRKDVESAIRARDDSDEAAAKEAPLFFVGSEAKETKSTDLKSRAVIRKLVRTCCESGWKRQIASMAAEGATDLEITGFVESQPEDPFTIMIGKFETCLRGGLEPGVFGLKYEPVGNEVLPAKKYSLLLSMDELVPAIRAAFRIRTPFEAEIRAESQSNQKSKKRRTA